MDYNPNREGEEDYLLVIAMIGKPHKITVIPSRVRGEGGGRVVCLWPFEYDLLSVQ